MPDVFIHSLQLFGIACLSRNRVLVEASLNPDASYPDTSVAIVMAAASAEGFINELRDHAHPINYGEEFPDLIALNKVLGEIEQSKGTTLLKYLAASFILPGGMLDRGRNPFQDLDLLFKIRNQHMHLPIAAPEGAGDGSRVVPKIALIFQNRGLARRNGVNLTWMSIIQTAAMAEWACQTAAKSMIDILDRIRDHHLLTLEPRAVLESLLEPPAAQEESQINPGS